MPPIVAIELNTKRLDFLIGALEPRAMEVLDKAAFDIEGLAKPMTAYDTGALRNSIYVSGASGGSTYGAAVAGASARRPKVRFAPEESPGDKFERIIGASVEYAYFQELYQPFLTPAVEMERPLLTEAWKTLFA